MSKYSNSKWLFQPKNCLKTPSTLRHMGLFNQHNLSNHKTHFGWKSTTCILGTSFQSTHFISKQIKHNWKGSSFLQMNSLRLKVDHLHLGDIPPPCLTDHQVLSQLLQIGCHGRRVDAEVALEDGLGTQVHDHRLAECAEDLRFELNLKRVWID